MAPANGRSGGGRRHGLLTAVARQAGVSVGTVSKVVHGRRDVGAETRARILEMLSEAGWSSDQPIVTAQRILVVFRDLDSPYPLELARGLVDAAAAQGFEVVVGTTMHRSVTEWIDGCDRPDVAGMVLVISRMTERDQRRVLDTHVPVVLVDPLSEPMPGVPNIGVTNWRGGRDAVQHLLDLGHRRIGIVAGRPHSPAGGARLQGYRAGLHEAGIAFDSGLVRPTDFDYEEAIEAACSLLSGPEPPTAVFATSDAQALGVLEAARRLHIAVPDELSVVSFDDTSNAATASPPLTAIRQPFEELGQVAIRVLQETLEGTAPGVDHYELATTLTVRASTAPAPAAGSVDHPGHRERS
ncbi:LacI family DNA-binding transcriptional regulator [Klenkia taihuensis]|uniref:LacI family DNA-binding transcriptional regulator n=1 Tax=Klenkia taihuensis TaxID=1225127 RepID=UPI000B88949F|nr:LacI family DNA-binding transcriptional regulator [Klenkia taihuensis]